jgi:hypothetical protein
MTARQVMDEIKTMTPEERAEVAQFLRELDNGCEVRYANDADVEKIAEKVFDRHAELMRKLAT